MLVSQCSAGLSAVLLTVPLLQPVQNEEEMLDYMKCLFGPEVQKYIMILFTRADELEELDQTIEEYLQEESNADAQQLVTECGRKFHGFNNKSKSKIQVQELLQKIEEMMKKNGGKFTMKQMRRNDSKRSPPITYQLEKKNMTIEQYLQDGDPELNKLVESCGKRYFCLDNESASFPQFKVLIHKIEKMVAENGRTHFTNDMFEETEKHIQKIQKQNLDKKIKQYKQQHKQLNETDWQEICWSLFEESQREAELKLTSEEAESAGARGFRAVINAFRKMCAIQ
ncbi:GTPase IMAP family member 8-like protein [Labeo rohita]|uniref:GTPase IMAP family member 8-like protein n=1 Tax=Labeo rohita TaxID=84645 RepID=A0A498LW58_LABRO|nr:GTPase IMAP family member 8-like protein [Labeo rohita]